MNACDGQIMIKFTFNYHKIHAKYYHNFAQIVPFYKNT